MVNIQRPLSLVLALILSLSLLTPAAAAETAATIQLTKTSGTVTVSKSNSKDVSMRAGMRLYNGYIVTTAAGSYAWISLDSSKLIKVDASSSVGIRKNGDLLEVNISYGSAFFDVSQKLNNNESLNVSTSTMTVGIRGTSGWVQATDQWDTQTCLLEGTSQCVVADPVSGQTKSTQLHGGDTAQCKVYSQDQAGDKCDILMGHQTTDSIPGYILAELVENVELCDKILAGSGLDVLADLAEKAGGDPSGRSPDGKSASPEAIQEAKQRQRQEEAEKARKQEEIDRQKDQQEHNVSTDNVWEQGQQPSQPSGGSSSGGSSTPTSTPPTPTTYTVTFNSQGGSDVAAVQIGYGNKVTRPGDPTRTGHTFGGWYKEAACTNAWDFDTDIVTEDVILYAKWTLDQYSVTFNSQGGPDVAAMQIGYGNKVTRPGDPTWTGYGFGGWYKEAACETVWDFDTDIVTEDVTLYAKWTLGQYTVKFDSQEGSAVASTPVDHGSTVTRPGDPTRTGHTFGGWYKEAACETVWDFDTDTVTGDVTLYAKWTLDQYLVTFNSQGGSAVESVQVAHGSKLTSLPTSTLENYTFDGWYTAATGGEKVEVTKEYTANTTLYAHWTIVIRTVTFDSQNGSDVAAAQVAHGNKVTRPGDPTRTGHTFGGWYKEAACENVWDFDTDTVTGDVTLYAKWTLDQYSVTFNSQGSPDVAAVQVRYGNKAARPGDPTWTGHTFAGWYKEAACETVWDFDTDTVTGDVTLYAKWVVTVTFELNGGTSTKPAPVTTAINGTITFPDTPTNDTSRSGSNTNAPYIFDGWYTEGGEEVTSDAPFSQDTTLYAHWKIDGWDWELKDDNATLRIYGTGEMGDPRSWDSSAATITKVEIEDGVTSIGNSAFQDCTALTSVSIGSGVTSIGSLAFDGCTALTGITVASGNPNYSSDGSGVLYNNDKTTLILYPVGRSDTTYTIPNTVKTIGDSAFDSCALTGITIPDSVTSIGKWAFLTCNGLTSVTIPNSVTSIGNSAFNSCGRLTHVTFAGDSKLMTIGEYAFSSCPLIDVAIPNSVDKICDEAFSGCTSLESVTIGSGVTEIGSSAFSNCTKLESVIFAEGSQMETIGYAAFYNCTSLGNVRFGGTRETWESINFGSSNDDLTGATIHCTDDDTP